MPSNDIQIHSLASGSSGNAVLIVADGRALLLDAGLGPRVLLPALHRRGISAGQLDAILLTHEHDDHLRGAGAASSRLRAPVVGNRPTLKAASDRIELASTVELTTGDETVVGAFRIRSFPVSHDAAEAVGYIVDFAGVRVAYATDVGCRSDALRDALRGAQLCILESNHDVDRLLRGPYPPHMKERVASDLGHLSNRDAAITIAERLESDGPASFWLAHLSSVNNSPAFARRYVAAEIAARTRVAYSLDVALRDRPSVSWTPGRTAAQLSLF